jgi:hypothetical protein
MSRATIVGDRRHLGLLERQEEELVETRTYGAAAILTILSLPGIDAWAVSAPVAVSPGSVAGGSIASGCPTLSWGPLAGAESYELVIYRVGEEGVEAEPVLSRHIPGAALGWTPSLDRCLGAGGYAWSVRATTSGGLSEWAEPLFFEVALQPSAEELAAALELLRRRGSPEGHVDPADADPTAGEPVREAPGTPTADSSRIAVVPSASTAGNPSAKLRVAGEVRTVDSGGAARLWGRGRPNAFVYARPITGAYCVNFAAGGVQFGLSGIDVEWGSAADACPAGTWVCRRSDVAACDTARPDTGTDGRTCRGDPVDYDANLHFGWLADQWPNANGAMGFFEDGTQSLRAPCDSFPVWCCW